MYVCTQGKRLIINNLNILFLSHFIMKQPAIIDKRFEKHYDYHLTVQLPHEEDSYDTDDERECLYAEAMHLLTTGLIEESKALLEKSYSLGFLTAGHTLAYGYGAGWYGEPDYEKEVSLLRQLVKKGDAASMNDYAISYEWGKGVKQNMRLAILWYRKAIDGGNLFALNNLAHIYIKGDQRYRNLKVGIRYAKFAAEHGEEMAQNLIGLCYEEGTGLRKNYRKAFEWYTKAVENCAGPCAEHNLARCYRLGRGTNVNMELADKYEKLAAEHGFIIK